jgi:hypothetical protein
LRIDTRKLEGSADIISLPVDELAARELHPDLRPHPDLPADTKLWAALQNASGGSWAGCVYDVERIAHLLERGLEAESRVSLGRDAATASDTRA